MAETYRLSWEAVTGQMAAWWESAYSEGYTPTVAEHHWHRVENVTTDPWDQYRQLREWARTGEQPIRNVVLERQVTQPTWEVVADPDGAAATHPLGVQAYVNHEGRQVALCRHCGATKYTDEPCPSCLQH